MADNTITGTSGDDAIETPNDNTTNEVNAGAGNDFIVDAGGFLSDDILNGEAGDDNILGGAGNDTINGGIGNDNATGSEGDDTFLLDDNFGQDSLTGGGFAETTGDVVDASNMTTDATLTFGVEIETGNGDTGTPPDGGGGPPGSGGGPPGSGGGPPGSGGDGDGGGPGDTSPTTSQGVTLASGANLAEIFEVESYILGSGNDTVIDDGGDNTVNMGAGDDQFQITDGSGQDSVTGGEGGETLGDLIDGSATTAAATVTFTGDGIGTFTDGINTVTFAEIERVETGAGNDTIFGGTGSESIDGNDGDDTYIFGDDFGNDTFRGGEGVETTGDTLDGTALTDGVTLTYTEDGGGTLTDGAGTMTFAEVEDIALGSGDDTVTGGTGNDSISLNDGDDSFAVLDGFGTDTVDGGTGGETNGDTLDGSGLTTDATLALSTANDGTLTSGANTVSFTNFDSYATGGGNDTITGSSDDDTIASNGGDDTFIVTAGTDTDTWDAGEGGETSGDVLDANALSDANTLTFNDDGSGTLSSGTSTVQFQDVENVLTGDGNDTITSSTGDETVISGAGDDTVILSDSFGNDSFDAGETGETSGDRLDASALTSGVTVTFSDAESGTISDGSGTTSFTGFEHVETGTGNDTIIGSTDDDTIVTNAGDDRIILADGFGSDSISAGSGGETLGDTLDASAITTDATVSFAGAEQGTLTANGSTADFDDIENIETGAGNDTVTSGSGDDTVTTNAGDDTFFVTNGFGNDTYNAGEGGEINGDRLDASALTSGVVVTASGDGDGTLTQGGNSVTFTDVEQIETGSGDDTVAGGIGDDSIITGAGDDTIVLNDEFGTDTISGGETGETTGDQIDGSNLTGDVTANLTGGGAGTLTQGANTATFIDIESLTTGAGDDTVTGSSDADTVALGAGDDTYVVADGFGNDVVAFGEGSENDGGDTLDASTISGDATLSFTSADDGTFQVGSETLNFTDLENVETGSGNDTVTGGTANDTVTTNGGDDTFILSSNSFGDDSFSAGETGETSGDTIDATGLTGNVTLNYSGTEDGTLSVGSHDLTFTDVETIATGSGDDTVISGTGDDTVSTNGGDDQFIVADGFGNDTFDAGSNLESSGDLIDGSALTGDTNVSFTSGQDGTLSDGTSSVTFTDVEAVATGSGNDTITGNTADNTVFSNDGDDTLVINNNFGNDAFVGGQGNETTGDQIDASAVTDDISLAFTNAGEGALSTGSDTVQFLETEAIETGSGDDTITSGSGNDSVSTNAGDDTFIIANGFGTDAFDAGEGGETNGDRIDGSALTSGATVTFTTAGDGTLTQGGNTLSFSDVEVVETGDGTDTITSSTGNDSIVSNGGADRLILTDGFGEDTFDAGAGSDRIDGSALTTDVTVSFTSNDTGTLTTGTDSVSFDSAEVIETGSGNDTITGSNGGDRIETGAGDDRFIIDDGHGNDNFNAGSGGEIAGDLLDASGLSANATININNAGSGTLSTNGGTVTFSNVEIIETGGGDDQIDGSSGDDIIIANAGDDTFSIDDGFGDDSFDGGVSGQTNGDTIDASAVNAAVTVNLTDTETGTLTANGDTLSFTEVENIVTGSGNDTITGSDGNDSIDAGRGDDTFIIADNFRNDTFNAGEGDITFGDSIDGSSLTGDATVNFTSDENGTVRVGTQTLTFTDVERITTGSGNDTISGSDNSDIVTTGDGDDRIIGNEGADTIDAGAGNDTVFVAQGDLVFGGSGDDTFNLRDYNESNTSTINIDGGDDTDTLRLGRLANLNTLSEDGSGNGSVVLKDGTLVNFTDVENVICFTPGTLIATPYGSRNINDLHIGDIVLTRDNGPQPIRWIQSRTIPAIDRFAPIRIRPGVIPGQVGDLLVSPQHRMLFEGYRAELLFGESEVLVSAKHLVDDMSVTQDAGDTVTYIHMMFDAHEIVFANGAASESFHPGAIGLTAVEDEAREELFSLFPELRSDPNGYGKTARRCLRKHETRLLSL